MAMTPREIILANLEHSGPERPGLAFNRERINDFVGAGLGPSLTCETRRWTEGAFEYYEDEWANVWYRLTSGSKSGEIFEPAVKEWSDLDTLRVPDFDDPRRCEHAHEVFSQPTDKFKLAHLPGWVFATSRYLRKMEIYFVDLIEFPDEINRLHTVVTDLFVRLIHNLADAGAEGVFYCEDLGTQDRTLVSPTMWDAVFRPHYDRLVGAAHERGMKVFMHSCGYNWALIDHLIDAGIDCFQFDQPKAYDMPALAAKLRDAKVGLYSPVDIQRIMPTGDRALIERSAREMVETFRGGLILNNYGDLPGIGVEEEWDQWAYEAALDATGVKP